MKELVILSGKGGTGKTSLTAAFAAISENRVLCDADVDAADLHLINWRKITMKFAIPLAGGKLTAHFGHCQEFYRFLITMIGQSATTNPKLPQ